MIAIQRVQILWTKATRGAPRANERAALPRALAVPHNGENFRFYFYQMLEENEFKINLAEQRHSAQIAAIEGSLVLKEEAGARLLLGLR